MPLNPTFQGMLERNVSGLPANYGGGAGFDTNGNPVTLLSTPTYTAQEAARLQKVQNDIAAQHRLENIAKLGSAAITGAGALGAAGAFGAGSAAASAVPVSVGAPAVGVPASVGAPAAVAGAVRAAPSSFSFNNLLQLGQLAVGGLGSLFGNRSQSRAQQQAAAQQAQEFAAQMAFAREQEAQRKAEADRVAAQTEAQWRAQQQMSEAQWRASEEQRIHDRQLTDAAEAWKAPRRQLSQQAMLRIADLLGMGRG